MPRRPILSPRSGAAGFPGSYAGDVVRHDVLFPGFGTRADFPTDASGRQSLEREVRETEVRLDHLLEEKRNLERKREELRELNEKQALYRDRRDKLVDEVLQTLSELQKFGHFEVRRAESFDRSGETVRELRLNLETLQRLELRDPKDHPALVEGIRRLRDAEAELQCELKRLDAVEDSAPVCKVLSVVTPDRRGFLGWAQLGLTFFLPVLAIGLVAVIAIVLFVGVK